MIGGERADVYSNIMKVNFLYFLDNQTDMMLLELGKFLI